jgi:fructose-1,6-bisphosphatase
MTLTEFILEEQRHFPAATGDFTALLNYVRLACKRIGFMVGRGGLEGGGELADSLSRPSGGSRPDLDANEIVLRTTERGGGLAAMASRAMPTPYLVPDVYPCGKYLLAFDALDGAGNIDVNTSVGSIFAVLRAPSVGTLPKVEDFLQPGTAQVAAGYAIYGPATMIVLTLGRGVHGFTLDRGFGEFVLTHRDMRVRDEAFELAINAGNERFWAPPVKRYVGECFAGHAGPRGRDFSIRWIASVVAEVHRILLRGGVFLHPVDARDEQAGTPLMLLHHANPIAMLMEQAGGAASTGHRRIMGVVPARLHEPVSVVLGSAPEVARVERYVAEHAQGLDRPFTSPLFNERSLFIPS